MVFENLLELDEVNGSVCFKCTFKELFVLGIIMIIDKAAIQDFYERMILFDIETATICGIIHKMDDPPYRYFVLCFRTIIGGLP